MCAKSSRAAGLVLSTCALLFGTEVTFGQADFLESFDGLTNVMPSDHGPPELIASGWEFRNQSDPLNSGDWRRLPWAHQGQWSLGVNTTVGWWTDDQSDLTTASHADSWIPFLIVEFEIIARSARQAILPRNWG